MAVWGDYRVSGDWIKMRCNLWDDPRVARICDLCECTEAPVVGALYWLWATADQHTEDGILPGLTLRQIDRKTGVDGFAAALCEVGWLADHPEGVRVVRFDQSGPLFVIGVDRLRPGASKWYSLREEVFKRDGRMCVYCGSADSLECDHITPVSRGGTHDVSNLATACFTCNRSKGSKRLEDWVRHGWRN